MLGFRASRGHCRNLREICFTTQWFLSQTDSSRPLLWPKQVTEKVPKVQNLQIIAKSLVSEPLVAIIGIYAGFALQRNGSCLKWTLLDPFCGQNRSGASHGGHFLPLSGRVDFRESIFHIFLVLCCNPGSGPDSVKLLFWKESKNQK